MKSTNYSHRKYLYTHFWIQFQEVTPNTSWLKRPCPLHTLPSFGFLLGYNIETSNSVFKTPTPHCRSNPLPPSSGRGETSDQKEQAPQRARDPLTPGIRKGIPALIQEAQLENQEGTEPRVVLLLCSNHDRVLGIKASLYRTWKTSCRPEKSCGQKDRGIERVTALPSSQFSGFLELGLNL